MIFRKRNNTAAVQPQVKNLEQHLCGINTWMAQNMNNGKTKMILFSSKKQQAEVNIQSLDVAGTQQNQCETMVPCLTQILQCFST